MRLARVTCPHSFRPSQYRPYAEDVRYDMMKPSGSCAHQQLSLRNPDIARRTNHGSKHLSRSSVSTDVHEPVEKHTTERVVAIHSGKMNLHTEQTAGEPVRDVSQRHRPPTLTFPLRRTNGNHTKEDHFWKNSPKYSAP